MKSEMIATMVVSLFVGGVLGWLMGFYSFLFVVSMGTKGG